MPGRGVAAGEGVVPSTSAAVGVPSTGVVSVAGSAGVGVAVTVGATGVPVGGSMPPVMGAVAVSVPLRLASSVASSALVTVTDGVIVSTTVGVGARVAEIVVVASGVPVTVTVPVMAGVGVITIVSVGATVAVTSIDGVSVFVE